MPELETEQSAEFLTPVAEPAPEMASPGLSPVVPGMAGTGGVGSRFGDIALMSGVQEPPPEAVASLLGHPRYGLPANAPQKTRLLIGLQQRYGNAYMRQVMTLVRQGSMAAAAPTEAAVVGTKETAPSQEYDVPAPTPAPIPSAVEAAATPPLQPSPMPAPTPEPAPPTGTGLAGMQAPAPSPETAPATFPVTMLPMTSDAGLAAEAAAPIGGTPASPSAATTGVAAAAPPAAGEESGKPVAPPLQTQARSETAAGEAAEAAVGKEIPRAPVTPGEDPAFQKAKNQVRIEAKRQKRHDPAGQKRQEAADASALTNEEQIVQSSKDRNTKAMEQVGAKQRDAGQKFSAVLFKNELKACITAVRPQTESQAKAFAQDPPVKHFEGEFSKNVALEQSKVTGPLEQQARPEPTGGVVEKLAGDVPAPIAPPAPKPVDPKLAIPKPKTDQEISLQHEGDRLDAAMQGNRLSDEQLSESREPSFLETLSLKQKAQQKVAEAPDEYRQRESAVLQKAEGQTDRSLSSELAGMSQTHHKIGGHVFGGQKATETKTEKRQRDIKKTIDDIYKGTVDGVKSILADMAKRVKERFTNSLKQQTEIFNNNVKRRISDYYGNWRIDDKLFGPADVVVEPDGATRPMTFEESFGRKEVKRINPDVYKIFVEEKDRFISAMDTELDSIANNVQDGLTAAHTLIKLGKLNIAVFKAGLQGEELTYAVQLEEEVKLKFENLEGSIDDAREDLLQTLADEYSENVKQLETTFNDINNELKKSWVDRAVEFIETVGKTIFQLAELLLSILVRVVHLVWDIIKHPIRFFETLVSGLMQGIGEFIGNIGTYLQEAFWTWITGATPVKNIRLSASSGIESLFDLVMQVLNLGPADLRAIVEKVLGKEFMQMVDKGIAFADKALEPVTILLTQGPVAFWHYLVDTLGSIIQSSFDRIRESVFNTFIEKGLKWIAGFFIPGGGFVKIVIAIFKAFQFVAENLENIRHFINSIFDSMEAAVEGSTEGVASKVITGLKIGVVLALDFLAKQLGLDKIVDGVQKIIQSLRRPIVNAIEWVLSKVKPLVMKMMRALGIGRKEQPQGEGAYVAQKSVYDGQIGKVVPFSAAGESHRLWIVQKGSNAVVMMSSIQKTVSDQLVEYQQMAGALTDENKRQTVIGLIGQARQMLGQLDTEADTLVKDISKPKHDSQQIEQQDQAVENDEERLATKLTQIREALGLVDPEQVKSVEVKKGLSLSGESHTLTATSRAGEIVITMASDQGDRLRTTLRNAIGEVQKWKPDPGKHQMLKILNILLKDADEEDIERDWILAGRKGKIDDFLAHRLAQIAENMRPLSEFGITNLNAFFQGVPDVRYLPFEFRNSDWIRTIYLFGKWKPFRDPIVAKGKKDIYEEVKDARLRRDFNKWNDLKARHQIPEERYVGSPIVMHTFDPKQDTFTESMIASLEYMLDHIDPLARHWNEKGNDTSDSSREVFAYDKDNLRVVTAKYNLSKGSGGEEGEDREEYFHFVTKNFSSVYKASPKPDSKTIGGKPFLNAKGEPIP